MSRARLAPTLTSEYRLREYHELIGLGVDHEHACHRVGLNPESTLRTLQRTRAKKGMRE